MLCSIRKLLNAPLKGEAIARWYPPELIHNVHGYQVLVPATRFSACARDSLPAPVILCLHTCQPCERAHVPQMLRCSLEMFTGSFRPATPSSAQSPPVMCVLCACVVCMYTHNQVNGQCSPMLVPAGAISLGEICAEVDTVYETNLDLVLSACEMGFRLLSGHNRD